MGSLAGYGGALGVSRGSLVGLGSWGGGVGSILGVPGVRGWARGGLMGAALTVSPLLGATATSTGRMRIGMATAPRATVGVTRRHPSATQCHPVSPSPV